MGSKSVDLGIDIGDNRWIWTLGFQKMQVFAHLEETADP
jgi:hypothetical protein